jgi:phenylacetate-coenzyme A ligase PaaK-like adenylate-forming protein
VKISEISIGGKSIDPEVIKNELVGVKGLVEYQLVVRKEDADNPNSPEVLVLRLSVAGRMRQELEEEVVKRVSSATGISPKIEYVQSPEIYDPSRKLKATRFLDHR